MVDVRLNCNEKLIHDGLLQLDTKIINLARGLFLYQFATCLASVYAIGCYLCLIVAQVKVSTNGDQNWQYIYYWQIIIAVTVGLSMILAMKTSLIISRIAVPN